METFKQLLKRGDVQLGCCIWLAAAFVAYGMQAELNKSEWASWVQAIGSLAALGVAIFVMRAQGKLSAELIATADKRAMTRRCHAVGAVLDHAQKQLEKASAWVTIGVARGDQPSLQQDLLGVAELIHQTHAMLSQIPVHELGSHEMAASILSFRESLDTCLIAFKSFDPQPHGDTTGVTHTVVLMEKMTRRAVARFSVALEDLHRT